MQKETLIQLSLSNSQMPKQELGKGNFANNEDVMRALLILCTTLLYFSPLMALEPLIERAFDDISKAIIQNDIHALENSLRTAQENLILNKVLMNYDKRGLTFLQGALCKKNINPEIIKLLLSCGSEPNQEILREIAIHHNCVFYTGYTATHIAVRLGATRQILMLLHENQADFFKKDAKSFTAVALADNYDMWVAKKFFREILTHEPYEPRLYVTRKSKWAYRPASTQPVKANTKRSNDPKSPEKHAEKNENLIHPPEQREFSYSDEDEYERLWEAILMCLKENADNTECEYQP